MNNSIALFFKMGHNKAMTKEDEKSSVDAHGQARGTLNCNALRAKKGSIHPRASARYSAGLLERHLPSEQSEREGEAPIRLCRLEGATLAPMIEITDYTDYLPYVNDLVRQKRKAGGFSYRIFCRKSGFHSPTYLKWVVDGVRPISLHSAHKFSAGLSLDKRESQYFILMVNYKEARHVETKRTYYEQMLAIKTKRAGSLTRDSYEYLSHWYYVAIRELVAVPDFCDNPRWIREKLGGDLTLWEIRNGMDTLSRLGLIHKSGRGRWQQTSRDLITEHEVSSMAAYNYHNEILDIARKALASEPAKVRDYQSVMALVDMNTVERLKEKIQDFQKNIMAFLQAEESGGKKNGRERALYALNLQLHPLAGGGKGEI